MNKNVCLNDLIFNLEEYERLNKDYPFMVQGILALNLKKKFKSLLYANSLNV